MIRNQFSYFLTISGKTAAVENAMIIIREHAVDKFDPLAVLTPNDMESGTEAGTVSVLYELKESFGGTIEDDTCNIVDELDEIAKTVPDVEMALDANDEDNGTNSSRYKWVKGEKTDAFVRTLEPDDLDSVTLNAVKEKLAEAGDANGVEIVSSMSGGAQIEHDRKVMVLLDALWGLLPHEPAKVWTKSKGDDEILCQSEKTAEGIADLIDTLYGGQTVNTGFYDPKEDERNGEADDRTGFYYVTIN